MELNEITYMINGAIFEVNSVLGSGFLKATGFKIGLLVNFKYPKAEIKRFIF